MSTRSTKPKKNAAAETEAEGTEPATQTARFASFTGADGNQYAIVIPKLRIAKKLYSAAEIAADETLREQLVAQAWQGRDGKLDEQDFDKNGVLRIVY